MLLLSLGMEERELAAAAGRDVGETNRPCPRAQGTNVKAVGVGTPGGEGRKLITRGKRGEREEDAERGL
jgi:hypothetical protein